MAANAAPTWSALTREVAAGTALNSEAKEGFEEEEVEVAEELDELLSCFFRSNI